MSSVVDVTTAPSVGKKAVLLFWAEWHEASAGLTVILTALASSNANNENVIFGRVAAEECADLTDKYGVAAVPTIVLVDENGNVFELIEGQDTGDVSSITQSVQRLIASTASTPNNGEEKDEVAAEAADTQDTSQQALTDRLNKLIRSNEVMLFMKGVPTAPRCGFSRQAVELLESEEISFGSFDILSDNDVRQGLKSHSNWPTYPQLYVNGELIGGLDIMKEMKEESTLKEQLGISTPKILSLNDRLKQLITRHKVMVFMKGIPSAPKCGFSRQMIELLDKDGVSYDAFNILEDEDVRQGLKTFSNWPTYPQLYVNGDLIGGLDICKELAETGEFAETLKG